jgi:uncharacterized Zn finger protein
MAGKYHDDRVCCPGCEDRLFWVRATACGVMLECVCCGDVYKMSDLVTPRTFRFTTARLDMYIYDIYIT